MKKQTFQFLATCNRVLLPSFTKRGWDLATAKKWQLAVFGYRLWVTKRAL
ncbi:MAG: hypothetical protein ACJARZ_000144 [Dokdonia sp.]|jgi:hypothetical protein